MSATLIARLRDAAERTNLTLYAEAADALSALQNDLEMWREIASNDPDKWSFAALMAMAKRILDTNYPTDIFIPKKVHTLGDDGDLSRVHFITVQDRNDGPVFVSLLREVIEQIEGKHERKT